MLILFYVTPIYMHCRSFHTRGRNWIFTTGNCADLILDIMKMSRVSDNFPVPGVSVLCFISNSVHLWTPPVLHQWWILFTMVEGYVMNPWTSGTRALKQKCVMCWRQTSVISGLPVASPQNVVARDNCLWKRKGLILLVEGSGMDGCAGTMQTREHGVMGPVRYSCPFLHHPVSWKKMIIFSLAF